MTFQVYQSAYRPCIYHNMWLKGYYGESLTHCLSHDETEPNAPSSLLTAIFSSCSRVTTSAQTARSQNTYGKTRANRSPKKGLIATNNAQNSTMLHQQANGVPAHNTRHQTPASFDCFVSKKMKTKLTNSPLPTNAEGRTSRLPNAVKK